jgi:hypothetical protein
MAAKAVKVIRKPCTRTTAVHDSEPDHKLVLLLQTRCSALGMLVYSCAFTIQALHHHHSLHPPARCLEMAHSCIQLTIVTNRAVVGTLPHL